MVVTAYLFIFFVMVGVGAIIKNVPQVLLKFLKETGNSVPLPVLQHTQSANSSTGFTSLSEADGAVKG